MSNAAQAQLDFGRSADCNRVKIGTTTTLFGDPEIKPEKPHTIIRFPGGDVEIARTSDGDYWVHVAIRHDVANDPGGSLGRGRIIRARMDHDGRYNDAGNAVLCQAVEAGDVNHIAFLIEPLNKRAAG